MSGGAPPTTGGAAAIGGAPPATGGAAAIGGAPTTGGASATGGAAPTTGGATAVNLAATGAGVKLFDFGSDANNRVTLVLNDGEATPGIALSATANGGAAVTATTPTQLPSNVWKHVAATINANALSIFVDGHEVARNATAGVDLTALAATTSNPIGAPSADPSLSGRVDEFYVYDHVLTLAEIQQLAWPKTDYSILHFEDAGGTAAADTSDNGRSGTLMNSATFGAGAIGNGLVLSNTLANPDATTCTLATAQYVELAAGALQNCSDGFTIATWMSINYNYKHMRVFDFADQGSTKTIFGRTRGGGGDYGQWAIGLDAAYAAASSLGATGIGRIGGSTTATGGGATCFDGKIDEFVISCRAYTQDEIKQLAYRAP